MITRNYLEYRRSSVAGYRGNQILISDSQNDLLTEILFRGNYTDFGMHPQYTAVWEEYTSRYRLIKVCPAFKVMKQIENYHTNSDLFALECIEDESFVVFVGTIAHIYSYGANLNKLRRAEVLYVLDWQISQDEEMLLQLSI